MTADVLLAGWRALCKKSKIASSPLSIKLRKTGTAGGTIPACRAALLRGPPRKGPNKRHRGAAGRASLVADLVAKAQVERTRSA